ncbi:hypothetical protein IPdc08_00042 [archaeon]|nr:hypothetical protein IPdc08_00042 [archaeon]
MKPFHTIAVSKKTAGVSVEEQSFSPDPGFPSETYNLISKKVHTLQG